MAGLPLSFAPSLPFHPAVMKHSTFVGKCSRLYHDISTPCLQHKKHNEYKLLWEIRCGGELAIPIAMPSKTFQVHLPALDCLFEEICNPNYELVRDDCDAWMLTLFDPPLQMHDPQYELYLKGLYSLFTSYFYPLCLSQRRLTLLTKLDNWLFIYDDIAGRADSKMQVELAHGMKSILEVLPTQSYTQTKQKMENQSCFPMEPLVQKKRCTEVFLDRFEKEVWKVICADMTPSILIQFRKQLLSAVGFHYEHERLRQKRRSRVDELKDFTLNDLIDLRLKESFSEPLLCSMMEYALDIDLEDILAQMQKGKDSLHEKVEKLKHVARCHTTWVNDFFSWRKEFFEDECLSLIKVLLERKGVSAHAMDERGVEILQDVIEEVWRLIKKQEELGASLLEEVKKSHGVDSDAHKQVVLYCEALCKAMAGNMYYSTLTTRYNGFSPLPWKTCTSVDIPHTDDFPTLDFLKL